MLTGESLPVSKLSGAGTILEIQPVSLELWTTFLALYSIFCWSPWKRTKADTNLRKIVLQETLRCSVENMGHT